MATKTVFQLTIIPHKSRNDFDQVTDKFLALVFEFLESGVRKLYRSAHLERCSLCRWIGQ